MEAEQAVADAATEAEAEQRAELQRELERQQVGAPLALSADYGRLVLPTPVAIEAAQTGDSRRESPAGIAGGGGEGYSGEGSG